MIVAATGLIGRHLLEQALAAGHDVTAVVRDVSALHAAVPSVTVESDPDPATHRQLRLAVAGADAVLSTLGPASAPRAASCHGARGR